MNYFEYKGIRSSDMGLRIEEKEVFSGPQYGMEFDEIPEASLSRYLDSDEPYDKAGAYAIQGLASAHIKGIEGDYFNVVGLPVRRLYETLREGFGIVL